MKFVLIAVTTGILLALTGCYEKEQEVIYLLSVHLNQETHDAATTEPQVITAQEAEAMMTGEGVIILDVRTQQEFDEGHIKNAVLLPFSEILTRAEEIIPNKHYVILIYCRSGNRSNRAARLLSVMGYTNVYDFGGIINWHGEIIK